MRKFLAKIKICFCTAKYFSKKNMTHIGKNIKKIRNVKGLSQQAFAELFDLTRGNISSYEESRAEPKIEIMMRIANYFSIPLSDLIEKDLSVNELLHYNPRLVVETEKLKTSRRLATIPFVSTLYINIYIQFRNDITFMQKLPTLMLPCNAVSELVAIELIDPNLLPAGFEYRQGDILVFEQVTIENIHRISGKLGMMADADSLKFGIYQTDGEGQVLSLNEWVKYPFDIDSDAKYHLLHASYRHE